MSTLPNVSDISKSIYGEVFVKDESSDEKRSALWSCIGSRPNKEGGKIYRFLLDTDYDVSARGISEKEKKRRGRLFQEKRTEIAPAIEFYTGQKVEDLRKALEKAGKDPDSLGYRSFRTREGLFMELPDSEALLSNWKKLGLPPLNIIESAGIATDLEYAKAHLEHDALLSSGREFLHDHLNHVIWAVIRKLDGNNSFKEKFMESLKFWFKKLEDAQYVIEKRPESVEAKKIIPEMEKLELALGALVDVASSITKPEDINMMVTNFIGTDRILVVLNKDLDFYNRSSEIFPKGASLDVKYLESESERVSLILKECTLAAILIRKEEQKKLIKTAF